MHTILARALIAVTFTATTALDLYAQSSPSTDGRRLPIGADTFTVSYGGSVIGRGVTVRSRVGRFQLLQVYTWRGGGGEVVVDSLFSDLESLRSVREVRVVADTVIEASFADDSIRVVTMPLGGPARRQSVPSSAAVRSSASLEALAAAAPLAPGYEQELRFYYAPPARLGVVAIGLRVVGTDTVVDRTRGAREAWVVSASTPGGGTTFWIDKLTRAVLKYDTQEGPATIEFRR